jgi:hypothetical protein
MHSTLQNQESKSNMDELSNLFAAYRASNPDPEASANFTPAIWKKIEAKRSSMRILRRFTEALVTVAALVTLIIGAVLIPRLQQSTVYSATYVDVLAAEHSPETMAYAEILHAEPGTEIPLR